MNKSTSLYLDFLRLSAALVVFFYHAHFPFFSHGQWWLPSFGHEMVIVFFVLSGFVIAYAAERSRESWQSFCADRLARLYSVIVPALVMTVVLDTIGRMIAPAVYAGAVSFDLYVARIAIAGFNLNQVWHLCSHPGSNRPFWSLAYEFWYYALFAGFFFARSWRWWTLWLLLFISITGFKIALLLPIWLMGVAAFHVSRRRVVDRTWGWILLLSSTVILALVFGGYLTLPGLSTDWRPSPPLFFSSRFMPDTVCGLLVALHLLGADAVLRDQEVPAMDGRFAGFIRFGAGRSFSLYAFHLPLLLFAKGVIPFDDREWTHVLSVLMLVLGIVVLLSNCTEHRREPWRKLFRRLLGVHAPELKTMTVGVTPDSRSRLT